MYLTPSMEKFIASWGKMASRWTVNRTVAEVHALFYLSAEPLNAEDVAQTLVFSRSNVSASLRELEGRGLISPHHIRGDRRQYYESTKNPWEVFQVILDDHKRRVIDPTVAAFKACLDEHTRIAPKDSYTAERMRKVVSFFEAINPLYKELRRLPNDPIQNLNNMAAKIREEIG